MRKLLSLLLAAALLLTIPFAFAEEREEVTLTMGKEFDYNGKHFLEGQSLENNYHRDRLSFFACVKPTGILGPVEWLGGTK